MDVQQPTTTTLTTTVALTTSTASVLYASTAFGTTAYTLHANIQLSTADAPSTTSTITSISSSGSATTTKTLDTTSSASSPSSTGLSISKPGPLVLPPGTIAWLAVISVIVLTTLLAVLWFLCLRPCIRRHHGGGKDRPLSEGSGVLDDRNQFRTWNASVPAVTPRDSCLAEVDQVEGTVKGEAGLGPREWWMRPQRNSQAHHDQGMGLGHQRAASNATGVSLVPLRAGADEEATPVTPRSRTTFYSRQSGWWRGGGGLRPSMIGRAM